MAKAAAAEVDFAQAVEEEEAGLDDGAFKFAEDEFERRKLADGEK